MDRVLRLLFSAAIFVSLCSVTTLRAFEKPKHSELPDFDKRPKNRPIEAGKAAAAQRLKGRLPGLQVDFDPILRTPRSVVARDGFLSGPRGRGRGVSPQAAEAIADHDPIHPLKGFLKEHAELFGHDERKLGEAKLKKSDVGKHNGLRSYRFEQELDGLEVYDAVLTAHITRAGELVSVSSGFLGDLEAAADAGTPQRRALQLTPSITAEKAVLNAAEAIGEAAAAQPVIAAQPAPDGEEKRQTFKAGTLPGEAEARLIWLPVDAAALRLCWEVEVTRRAGGERYRVLIDAQTGETLIRQCLTRYADATYRVFTSDSPSPFSPGHQRPSTNQPPVTERTLLTMGALNTNASPTGWIHPGDNETRGNNVDAHLDANADDLPDLPRPQGEPFRVFDFPIDFSQPPSTYGKAAVVQLFYWCNWVHDTLYDLGFTESAGNFQKDNFGRGGKGNDLILADAQDGSGTDNANYTPAPDGRPGRIQMFTFTGPEPDRDGDFDAEIIIHEYVHGLSDRLVGGGGGLNTIQAGGMGEGWSDFYALCLLSEPSDDPHAAYAMGGYATDNFFGLKENYYFGIRRYPYSTDLSKNPLTFRDIDPTQASAHPGVPLSPLHPFNPLFASEVHNQGEVWCVALWEMRANLVDRYGFAGNRLALQLVTDGMKLTPRNPTFLQARDAIVLADQVNNGGENFMEIWRAFAKRGMGFDASSPDSSRTDGVREAFNSPDALLVVPSTPFLSGGVPGGPLAPECATYLLTNHSDASFSWRAVTSENWFTVTPDRGVLTGKSGAAVKVCLNANASGLPFGSHSASIVFSNETTGVAQSREVNVRITGFTTLPFNEDFESGTLAPHWLTSGTGAYRMQVTDQNTPRGQKHLTFDNFGNGIESRNELTLGIDLAGFSNVVMRFYAKQYGEEPDGPPPVPFVGGADFDGVAISANGVEWYEVQSLRELNGTYAALTVNLDDAIARFGLSYNQNFRIRFNEFDNFSIPLDGIAIDDIQITGEPVRRLRVDVPPEAREGEGGLTGTVSLGVATTRALEIHLSASEPSRVQVPATVTLAAGATQAVFAVTIVDNGLTDGSQTVTVNAAAPEFFTTPGRIIVHDNEANRLRVRVAPNRAREGDGFFRKMGVVRLDRKPSRDVQVKLTSSDFDEVRVVSSVTVRAGEHAAEFDVFIPDDQRIDGTSKTLLTAQVENWQTGTQVFEVEDNDLPGLRVGLPARASEGNNILTNAARLRLLATLPTNLVVSLSSTDGSELIVPATVTIPAGRSSATFDLTIMDDADIDGSQAVSVTASAPGHPPASATMDVLDDETPPAPYQPFPAHQASAVSLTTDLSWLGGVGEIIRNGDFETGDFTGWGIQDTGLGGFVINDGRLDPQSLDGPSPPYEGRFSIMTDQIGGGSHVLFQDFEIPAQAKGALLSWVDKIRNHSIQYDFNQNFRVEIRDTANQVLKVVFSTFPGFPLTNDWTRRTADLTEFRGRTLRIAFVEEDHLGFFNVHLDNISVFLEDTGLTTFDVYFGTNAPMTSGQFLGNTVSNTWKLPDLALNTKYFWQVISRRGTGLTPGPVWEFTTRGVGKVNHFDIGAIGGTQTVGQPFTATITARDDIGNVARDFRDQVQVSAFRGGSNSSAVVITEIDAGSNDRIEFMNVSGRRLDLSNWQIVLYDTRSWPEPRMTFTIPTNSVAAPGQLFLLTTFGTAPGRFPSFFTGTNLAWSLAAFSNYVAVMVRDVEGRPVDFFCAVDANPAAIMNPLPVSQAEWSGPPVVAATNSSLTYQRTGSVDVSTAENWVVATNGIGRRNPGVPPVYAPQHPIKVSPVTLTNFLDGVWTGELTFEEPAAEITLLVKDPAGHFGMAGTYSAAAREDLAVSVTDSPDLVVFGSELAYQIAVVNTGPGEARGVVLSNALPAQVEFVSAAASQGTCVVDAGTVRCDLGDLPPRVGDAPPPSATVTLVVRPTATGVVTNTATVSRLEADGYAANNVATAVSTVVFPGISSGPGSVTEGHTNRTNMVFTFRLSAASKLPVSAEYRTLDVTATAGVDYVPQSGVLRFAAGTVTQSLAIEIIGDRLDEQLEQFAIELSSPVNAATITPQVRGRINDDDPTPFLTISDVAVAEPPPGGTTNVVLNARLSAPSGLNVTLNYTTTNGTALAGRDYMTEFGQLVFPPGTTNQSFSVRVNGDTVYESNEVFFVNLFSGAGVTLSDPQAFVTIEDNGFVDLDHFAWEPIASPQTAGAPFDVTITARDGRNSLFTPFNGTVRINAISSRRESSVASGTNRWEAPMGTLYHDARTQIIYLADEIGGAGKINALALNVISAPGQTMSNWTIRLKSTPLVNFTRAAWESDGWTVVYRHDETIQGTNWVTFFFDRPFDYDGTNNLMVDLSFDNSSYTFDGEVAALATETARALSFQTDSAFGDPLDWTGTSFPPPVSARRVPHARFTVETFLDVAPAQAGPFANGVWTGPVSVLAAGTNVFLRATDDSGRSGGSGTFRVDGSTVQALSPSEVRASVSLSGGDLCLTFMAASGRDYRVEATDSLSAPNWITIGDKIPGTGSIVRIMDARAVGLPQRFYRVTVIE